MEITDTPFGITNWSEFEQAVKPSHNAPLAASSCYQMIR